MVTNVTPDENDAHQFARLVSYMAHEHGQYLDDSGHSFTVQYACEDGTVYRHSNEHDTIDHYSMTLADGREFFAEYL
jgi:hypothetical protein